MVFLTSLSSHSVLSFWFVYYYIIVMLKEIEMKQMHLALI